MRHCFNLGLSRDDGVYATSHAKVGRRGTDNIVRWRVFPCAFVEVQPLIYRFFCLTTKHKPFCQTNGSCVGERGQPGPKLQRWTFFDSCFHLVIIPPSHSRIFGLPKVFLSRSPSSPSFSPPLTLSLFLSPGCDWLL